MKLEIEINKLRQKINSEQCSAIANQTNEIFQLINNYNRDLLSKCR